MDDLPVVGIASGFAEPRERWSGGLGGTFDVCAVGTRGELERVLIARKPGVLVLDVDLPGLEGIDGLPDLQRISPATRTIVLSERETESEGTRALLAGAKGYYSRAIDTASLGKAVASVRNGELWVRRALVHTLLASLVSRVETAAKEPAKRPDRRHLERLTRRQREVAEAIADGASNKEIARRLNVTERTVKAHLTEMFRNVGVFDRLHLALLLNDVPGARFDAVAAHDARAVQHAGSPLPGGL